MAVAYKPMKIPSPPKTPPPILIKDFLGVDFAIDATVIDNRRSPDMLNMIPDVSGILNKRTGYSSLFPHPLGGDAWADSEWATAHWGIYVGGGDQPIRGIFEYRKSTGEYERLVACSGHLFSWDDTGADAVEIYSALADGVTCTFEMNGKLYIQDGTNYLEYDGATVAAPTPYIPTLTKGRAPTGGGSAFEDFNLLGAGFKDSFSGTGAATLYTMSLIGLDATLLTVTVGGVAVVETVGFTVNRTTGVINFAAGTAPHGAPALGTDNVVITAYKTVAGLADRIQKCTFNTLFGGSNDGRVFVSGNPTAEFWNVEWYCGIVNGVGDPTYFPENNFIKFGKDAEKVTGYCKQYDYLVVFKENSTWSQSLSFDADGLSIFPIKPLNDSIGCIAHKSIAIINNNPVVLSNKGVYMLQASQVRDERNFIHLSQRIDPRLLIESSLSSACGIDHDNKYHLAINNTVYVFDYQNMSEPDEQNKYTNLGEWYFWNNLDVCYLYVYDSRLYFGSCDIGMIYKFKLESEPNAYTDDGVAIECWWYGKQFNMDSHSYKKNVDKIFVTLQPDNKTSTDLYYISDGIRSALIETISQYLYSYSAFNFLTFNFLTNRFPTSKRSKVKAKKIVYFQPILKNSKLNESMGIQALEIHYTYVSEVK